MTLFGLCVGCGRVSAISGETLGFCLLIHHREDFMCTEHTEHPPHFPLRSFSFPPFSRWPPPFPLLASLLSSTRPACRLQLQLLALLIANEDYRLPVAIQRSCLFSRSESKEPSPKSPTCVEGICSPSGCVLQLTNWSG